MSQLRDAIGQPIVEGYAAQVDDSRGAVRSRMVYVLGTKGNRVVVLGSEWGVVNLQDLVKAYKEGNPDIPTYTKVTTRIIMLNK